MTDEPIPAPPEPVPAPPPAAPKPPPPRPHHPGSVLRVLTAAGFLAVAIALFALWQRQATLDSAPSDAIRVASLEAQVHDLQQRLATLESRPLTTPPPPPDLRPIDARLAALEARPAATIAAPPQDLAPLEARVAAAERLARLDAAARALDAGESIGPLPDAPPALARFATTAPPTLTTLRAAFPAAARAARAASHAPEATGWTDRIRQGLGNLVTLRNGNTVLIGSESAATLATAQSHLDQGDLPGSLAALALLDPAAAVAMQPWRDQAQSLLDARAALAGMGRK